MSESLLTLLIAMLVLLSAFWKQNICTNLARFVHFNRDAEGCWWQRDMAPSFPVWLTTSYRSSTEAGMHSIMAISSDKFARNNSSTTQPVSYLSSLVFSLPLEETISAQV
jgi:hypothetical protein